MTTNSNQTIIDRVRHIAFNYYRASIHLYVLTVLIHSILDLIFGESWVFIAFLNTFAHLIWFPAFILFLFNLLLKQWGLSAILLLPILAFLFTWGTMFLPQRGKAKTQADNSVRIVTYNLKGYNPEQENIVDVIREVDADIVALQELSHINSPAIESQLQDTYPYMAFHITDNVTQGQGILSRYPISDDSFWMYDFAENMLGHQRTEIELGDNRSIIIYNVHPSHPAMQGAFFDPRYRSMEIDAILERSTKEHLPQLIVGDFNMPELSDDYAKIRMNYNDAYRLTGYGMGSTFPSTRIIPPFLRLDYIFFSEGIIAQNAQVWSESAGSDHRPLVVDLLIASQ